MMGGKSWRWRWDALAIFVGEECAAAEAEAAKQAFMHHRDDRHTGAAGALSRVLDQMTEMTAEPAHDVAQHSIPINHPAASAFVDMGVEAQLEAMWEEMDEARQQPAPTLDDTLAGVLAWQLATFGAQDAASVLTKLRSEVAEVGDAAMAADRLAGDPRAVLTECADVLIMLAGFVAARGFTIADLRDEVGAKDKINHGRTWRQNADGTWSHVKGGE